MKSFKGFDSYNAALTGGDVSSSLGVNCGMSTGRQGVMESFFDYIVTHEETCDAVGVDVYNLCETGDVARTVTTPGGGLNEHIPVVREPVSATTGYYMSITEDGITPSLLSRDYKDPQIVTVECE